MGCPPEGLAELTADRPRAMAALAALDTLMLQTPVVELELPDGPDPEQLFAALPHDRPTSNPKMVRSGARLLPAVGQRHYAGTGTLSPANSALLAEMVRGHVEDGTVLVLPGRDAQE